MKTYSALATYAWLLKMAAFLVIALGLAAILITFLSGVFSGDKETEEGFFLVRSLVLTPLATIALALPLLVASEFVAAYRDVAINTELVATGQEKMNEMLSGIHSLLFYAHKHTLTTDETTIRLLTEQAQYLSDIASKD